MKTRASWDQVLARRILITLHAGYSQSQGAYLMHHVSACTIGRLQWFETVLAAMQQKRCHVMRVIVDSSGSVHCHGSRNMDRQTDRDR